MNAAVTDIMIAGASLPKGTIAVDGDNDTVSVRCFGDDGTVHYCVGPPYLVLAWLRGFISGRASK